MARITFEHETVKELQDRLTKALKEKDLRLFHQISVLLAIADGEGLKEIQKRWRITDQTIYNWAKNFVEKRWDSLIQKKSTGRPSKLSKEQKQQLYEVIKAGPEAAGYNCGCWTTVLIQDWIEKHLQVTYNRYYLAELLRELGCSYQKARFISDHLDEEKRKAWVEKEWPAILAIAKHEKCPIFFGDEVIFAQWGSLSYTWAPIGQQPEVKTSGIRKRYKLFGLIEFFTGMFCYQESDLRFNSKTYAYFLSSLLKETQGKIIVIQDGAKYHTSREMQIFFEEHKDRIIMYQLPSYSPDYNPIEKLWKKVKVRATHNRYFAEFKDLAQSVEDALASLDAQPDEILKLMGFYTNLSNKISS